MSNIYVLVPLSYTYEIRKHQLWRHYGVNLSNLHEVCGISQISLKGVNK